MEAIFEAIRSGHWAHVIGLLTLIAVAGVKHYGVMARLPEKARWVVPLLMAAALAAASGLLADLDWLTIVQMAVTAGVEASGAHAWIKQAKPGPGIAVGLLLLCVSCGGSTPQPVTPQQAVAMADAAELVADAVGQADELTEALAVIGREAAAVDPDEDALADALETLLDVAEPAATRLLKQGDDLPPGVDEALLALRLGLVALRLGQ